MEKLIYKYENACKASARLKEALDVLGKLKPDTDEYAMIRDSVIQRFEFTIDTFWKFLKYYLRIKHDIDPALPSPRTILKSAGDINIIPAQEMKIFFSMLSDRNASSHTYNVDLAEEIAARIPNYWQLIDIILKKHSINT